MSKEVFTQVLRGAHEWVRQAEEALEKAVAEYGADTRFLIDVPLDDLDPFLTAIRDATAGRARCAVKMPTEN